ncbi:Potassium voltage-gated channel subfamily KQT member 4 [Manis javanica]|nr:Potassium voltage-gated channel subfamily KQT member 4 [Manis javanica]
MIYFAYLIHDSGSGPSPSAGFRPARHRQRRRCSSGAECGVDQAGHQGFQKKGDKGHSDSEAEVGISMRGPVVKVQKQQMQICGT